MYTDVQKHFDEIALKREYWEKKNSYYYDRLKAFLKKHIPKGKKILEIGCGRATLLKSLQPSLGIGIDLSSKMLLEAKKDDQNCQYAVMDAANMCFSVKFDYIILSDVLGNLTDIQKTLEETRSLCDENTKVIITYFNYIYEPIFTSAEKLRLKMPQPLQSWLSYDDVNTFLDLAGLSLIQRGRIILMPKKIPLLSQFINRFIAPLPLINHFCITQFWIGKLSPRFIQRKKNPSVSIIVPSRNEKGNIESIVERIPNFGENKDISPEIVFVEGGSTDGTQDEIERIKEKYSNKNIKSFTQDGKGKANADYKGMDNAKSEIFMILDADMTVAPEELPRFYDTLLNSNADLVMGSRLVYPMEKGAMRFLNHIGNKFFGILISWIVGQRMKDTLCGTKILFKKNYFELKEACPDLMEQDPFGDFFFIIGTARTLGKIVEIPIRYKERTYGSTNISRFKHGLYLLKMCSIASWNLKFK